MDIFQRFSLILIILAFVIGYQSNSQAVFSISEINTNNFPKVQASFVALNAAGNNYTNITSDNFTVIDNGINVTPSLRIDCIDTIVDPAVSVLLVLDRSTSMYYEYPNGETRWSWVKEGATAFINTINLANGTKIAITSFAKLAGLACPFTNDKQELLDSLDEIKVGGGTEYDPPFLDHRYGAVSMFQSGSPDTKIRRIVIFLTDGEPNHPPTIDSIKRELNRANIQVYSITLALPMNKDLLEISKATGGGAYAVYTKEDLRDIYKYIAIDIQKKQICTMTWDSYFGCTDVDRYRNVSITFKPLSTTIDRYYEAPLKSIAYVELSDPFLEFGNPPANNSVDRDLVLTARNSDFILANAQATPGTFFQVIDWDVNGSGGPPPFVIQKDSSRTIKIRFTQGASVLFRQATLVFDGSPCPPSIQLLGGITQIRIVAPNGGEIFSTCDTIEIKWAGVEANKPVNLSYSMNDGASWLPIANNVTGLRYLWYQPNPGTRYRIRGTVSSVSSYMWANNIGGSENDVGASIAVTNDDRYFYVVGSFEGQVTFGSKTITSKGGKDIYISKYDADGNMIWTETAGSPLNDSATAVCVDELGNAYVTGNCYSGIQFGTITPNLPVVGKSACFIARYAPNGGTPALQFIAANPTYTTFEATGSRIRYRPAQKELDVRGLYINAVSSPFGYSLPRVTTPNVFTAVIKNDLSFGPVARYGDNYPDYSSNVAFDSDGNRYTVGTFSNNITFGSTTLTSKGKTDIYINKFGGTPGSEDISDSTFTVESPRFNFSQSSVTFPPTMLGSTEGLVVDKLLCNVGTLPIQITNTYFAGANPDEFILTSNPISRTLQPGECMPLEIAFQPKNIGPRSAQLIISGTCTQDIFLNVSGDGVCGGETVDVIDFGKVNISFNKTENVNCIFKNSNPTTVTVRPRITGPNASDFSVSTLSYLVEPDSCLTLDVTFTPTVPGLSEAVIEFQLPAGCENPITELRGEGVETALVLNSINWGDRRVLTVNDSTIVIVNNSILPAKIDSLKFDINTDNAFTIISPPALPYSIPANDSLVLSVQFTPKDETYYRSRLFVYAQSNVTPLESILEGTGIIPKFNAVWVCDEATIPGQSSTAQLIIENLSSSSELVLYSADFRYKTGEFVWSAGSAPSNVIIPKSNSRTFDIIFTPAGSGTRADLIDISHDGTTGPDVRPVVDTTVDAQCDGLGLTVVSKIDFKNVLICDEYSEILRLSNDSWQTPISVTNANITGPDAGAFSINFTGNVEVPPGNFSELEVRFEPKEVKLYRATLTLETDINYNIIVELEGYGDNLYFTAQNAEYKNEPGYPIRVPVNLRVNQLSKLFVPEIKVEISYDEKMLRYDRVEFNNYPNWTWNQPRIISKGLLEISGFGNLPTAFDNKVFEIQWTVFLADVKRSGIKFKPIMGNCLTRDTTITEITYMPFCFMDGRLVVTGSKNYYLSTPEPNPSVDKATIKFGIGLDGYTEISLYNSLGIHQRTFVQEELKSGEYELDLLTNDFSSGTYILILRSGHIVKTTRLVITK